MYLSEKVREKIRILFMPVILQIAFLLFSGRIDREYRVYLDLAFYAGIAIYFVAIGSISFKSLWKEWKQGRKFWVPVLFALIAMIGAFGIGEAVSSLFPNADDGIGVFKVVDIPSLLAFAATTVFLPPIAEEAFYRKGVIIFDNRLALTFSAVAGIFLYASEHSMKPLGLLIAAIWAIPFTAAYIKTRNIYIPMTAHFICNLAVNGITVVFSAVKLLQG